MSKRKFKKKYLKRATALGMAMAMAVAYTPADGMQLQAAVTSKAATEKVNMENKQATQEVAVEDQQVDASSYELLGDVQGSSILHCWNWSYKTIEEHMELIAQSGYTALQTSPAQQPKDYLYGGHLTSEVGYPGLAGKGNWWKLYQPVTFNVCNNGLSWLGTKEELESMCKTAEKYGIKVIVDIVANHMGNISGWKNSLSDISPQVGEYWNKDMMTDESYWHINDLQVWMSDGREHFTQGTMGMPDLNTQDKRVQKFVYEYLDELIDCGVDGFRFDAAKHIETPDDAGFGGDFWPTVLNEARSHYKSVAGGDLYVYGEVLNTVGDNFSIDSYTKYMSVTDNSAGHHMLESVRNGQASTPGMHYPSNKAVIWAESHDTYMNESSRYASDKSVVRAWAMIANKKDAASLFFARPYYSKDTLLGGNDGQERGNLANDLEPALMGACETYVWASKEVAAINHFNNRMAGAADDMGADGNIAYVKRGDGLILVNFGGAGTVSTGAHGLPDGSYKDEVSGGTFQVSGGNVSGSITSEYGVAVLYKNTMPNPGEVYPARIESSVQDGLKFYTDILPLTITTKYADSASYTTSAGEQGTLSGEKNEIEVGKGVAIGDKLTVTVTAKNATGTYEKTYTYTKEDLDLDQCIFFKTTKNWTKANAYIYYQEGKDTTTKVEFTGWSGEPMFKYKGEDGTYVYAVMVEDIDKYNNVIFNNNVAEIQTSLGAYGQIFDADKGSWSQYMEPGSGKAKVSSTLESTTIHGAREVTFTVSGADSAVYTIDGGQEISINGSATITIGDGLEEGKSQVVKVTAKKGDKVTEKVYTYTMGENKPELSISPNDGDVFEDTLELTLVAENTEEAFYKIGKEEAVSFKGTKKVSVGKDMKDGEIVQVKVSGKSSNGKEDEVTATFTKETKDNNAGTCIYVKNTKDWNTVTAYVWIEKGNDLSSWPGSEMTLVDKENKIYALDLGSEKTFKNVIFSNKGASQTADLTLPGLGQLYDLSTGKWAQYGEEGLRISSSLSSRTIDKETEITITARAAKSATVSINGKETKFTDSTKVIVGTDLKEGEQVEVVVTATDGTEEITRTFIYTMAGKGNNINPSKTPNISTTPQITETPEVKETPGVSTSPNVMVTPGTTENSKESDKPKETERPSQSSTPAVSNNPEDTEQPKESDRPTGSTQTGQTPEPEKTTTPGKETIAPLVTPDSGVGEGDIQKTVAPDKTELPDKIPAPTAAVSTKPSVASVSFEPGAVQVMKNVVRFTVKGKGGSGNYLYSMEILNSKGQPIASKMESSTNKFSWTPSTAGTYTVYVDVKDTKTGITSKGKVVSYVVVKKKLSITEVKLSKKKIVNKKTVSVTTTVTGGKTKYLYAFKVKDSKGKTVKNIKYQISRKMNWKPSKTGTYTIYAYVKDATNTVRTKKKTVKVVKK